MLKAEVPMTNDDVLTVWEEVFPPARWRGGNGYPESFIVTFWRSYSASALRYALEATRKRLEAGKLRGDTVDIITRYATGILKTTQRENADVDEAIARRKP